MTPIARRHWSLSAMPDIPSAPASVRRVVADAEVEGDLVQDAPAVLDEPADDDRLRLRVAEVEEDRLVGRGEVPVIARVEDREGLGARGGPGHRALRLLGVRVPTGVGLDVLVVADVRVDARLEDVVSERIDQEGEGAPGLVGVEHQPLDEAGAAGEVAQHAAARWWRPDRCRSRGQMPANLIRPRPRSAGCWRWRM